jgi:hypothetical protein
LLVEFEPSALDCSEFLRVTGPGEQLVTRLASTDGSLVYAGRTAGPCSINSGPLEGPNEPSTVVGTVSSSGALAAPRFFTPQLDAERLFPYQPGLGFDFLLIAARTSDGLFRLFDDSGASIELVPGGPVTAVAYDPNWERLAIATTESLILSDSPTTLGGATEIALPPGIDLTQLRFDPFGDLYLAGDTVTSFEFNGATVDLGDYDAGFFLIRILPNDDNAVDVVRVFGALGVTKKDQLAVKDLELWGLEPEVLLVGATTQGHLDVPSLEDPPTDGASYLLRFACP